MKIAVMGDLHYVQDRNYYDATLISETFTTVRNRFFHDFLRNFFAIDANYYVSIGDLTNYGTEQELTEVYEKIKSYNKPFFHTFGNHDLYAMTREKVIEITGQTVNHALELDDVKLIFWETAREMDREVYGGIVTKQQLSWLEKELEKSGDKTVILFGHHPIYNTTFRSNFNNLSIDPTIDVDSVLKKKTKGKAIYVCGHNHFDSIVTKDNWTFVQIAAVLDVPAARIFEINNEKITISTIDLLDDTYVDDTAYIGENMNYFNNIWDAKGTPLQRNTVIPLTKEMVTK